MMIRLVSLWKQIILLPYLNLKTVFYLFPFYFSIVDGVEWLWNPADSFVDMFLWTLKCRTFESSPIILIVLTNKNVVLVYFVMITICQKKTKDCAPSGSFQNKLRHRCFHNWCLPLFITSLLWWPWFQQRIFSSKKRPMLCAQDTGIARGQTLRFTTKRNIWRKE